MEAFKTSRKHAKASISRIVNWIDKNKNSEIEINKFKVREDRLNEAFRDYSQIQNQIEDLDIDNLDNECRDEIEDKYIDALTEIKNIVEFLSPLNQSDSQPQSIILQQQQALPQAVKLPELNIPVFSGNITEWESFYQLFAALIINNATISDIQKFMYLKSYLKGEPLHLIEPVNLTHDNFKVALNILIDRYQNQFAIINLLINNLVDLPNLIKCTASSLREFITCCKRSTESLKNLNCPVDHWDLLLLNILERKLDFGTRKAFESERDIKKLPTLKQFLAFLERRCVILENLSSSETVNQKTPNLTLKQHSQTRLAHFSGTNPILNPQINNQASPNINKVCIFCSQIGHRIYSCQKFKNLHHSEKLKYIHSKQMCTNCLGTKHTHDNCVSQGCTICSKRHHTILHLNFNQQFAENRNNLNPRNYSQIQTNFQPLQRNSNSPIHQVHSQNAPTCSSQNGLTLSALTTRNTQVLLATANVTLYSIGKRPIQAKALLDSGSQNSFVTQKLINKLEYTPYEQSLCISGISQNSTMSNKMADIFLYSNVESDKKFLVSCAILEKITCNLPQTQIDPKCLNIPNYIKLANPDFFVPSEIDILLGADIYYSLLCQGLMKLGKNLPYLQNTFFGWIIAGSVPYRNDNLSHVNHSVTIEESVSLFSQNNLSNLELDNALTNFWRIEEVSVKAHLTPDEELAEEIFKKGTKILENGSFQVDLPLKSPNEPYKLGDSYSMARKRFFNLEKRFVNNPQLHCDYRNFINEYIALNHAKIIPLELQNSTGANKFFLPHHCVLRDSSETTKLRVVFDGSATSSSGLSLNDMTLKGFKVQPDLFDILCRFRLFKYVLTTDIKKMYRQVRINPEQTFLQNILWRNNPNEPLKCIELSTVTYGTNCAPYLATRVLKEVAQTNISQYPLAADALLNQCYVDDILTGSESYTELENTYSELNSLLNSAGFQLHKWCSSNPHLSKKICKTSQPHELKIKPENTFNKVLGLSWDPQNDNFSATLPSFSDKPSVTKREVLSLLAQMFDPIGFIGPVIVTGKIIMQKIWLSKITWDQRLEQPLLDEWNTFIKDIPNLVNLKIPRYLFQDKIISKIELHAFADASMKAYAACIYLRAIFLDGSISCNLVASKSRVAPVKTISVPRLELCAMLLLSQLTQKIISIVQNKIKLDSTNLWTDSLVALYWIRSHPSRWSVFVANRVSKIQELTENYHWRHVKSAENPADILSRGMAPSDILNSLIWWHGPEYLHNPNTNFDIFISNINLPNPPEENKTALLAIPKMENEFWTNLFSKFSNFSRLQRTVAYCLRFINNAKINSTNYIGPSSVTELQNSLDLIIKQVQLQYFSKEISDLKENKALSNKNLLSLNPFIDHLGFLCVGGRLENADIPYRQKHPILLPCHSSIVSLLLKQEHIRLGHAGPQNMLSNIRLIFWPISGLRESKRIVKNCLTCHRFRANSSQQIMANLPKERVLIARPFEKVGVDFGGPFLIKSSKLRKSPLTKCYMAIFVCMATKAVHIELVSSLSADAFLMTFKRFISRRGNPSIIFSDNATNFVGSKKQISDLYNFLKDKEKINYISEFLSTKQIRWKFIPPRSPHWGGIWESAIKSAKYHLNRLLGTAHFTFEELTTILTQIEAILNSRPLCSLSTDPSDFQCLTPGHFLIGTSLSAYPERDVTDIPENRLKFYQRCTQIQQTFWKHWSIDYLNRLQNRPKWLAPSKNLKLNDLVLVKEDNTPPLKWPLARVIEVMPGSDGKVRVVKIKTQDSVFLRTITKLCPLPIEDNEYPL